MITGTLDFLPPSVDEWLPQRHVARFVVEVIEGQDLSELVKAYRLGGSPLHWRRILLWSPETQVATITSESVARTAMVQAQVAREEERQVMPPEQFLASLQVRLSRTTTAVLRP